MRALRLLVNHYSSSDLESLFGNVDIGATRREDAAQDEDPRRIDELEELSQSAYSRVEGFSRDWPRRFVNCLSGLRPQPETSCSREGPATRSSR